MRIATRASVFSAAEDFARKPPKPAEAAAAGAAGAGGVSLVAVVLMG
ncbi:hypothetical protein GCM10009416_33060 [Craurococcus roseus]|uniref:Uncharacterized protein n=1 Tax=Craurococcus roseus TaxID=77585 RepID=A0ABP3QJC2_9PROT